MNIKLVLYSKITTPIIFKFVLVSFRSLIIFSTSIGVTGLSQKDEVKLESDVTQNTKLVADVKVANVKVTNVESISKIIDMKKYSSLLKLLRISAYVLRFIKNCRSETKLNGNLTVGEREDALIRWIKCTQVENFDEEINWVKSDIMNTLHVRRVHWVYGRAVAVVMSIVQDIKEV